MAGSRVERILLSKEGGPAYNDRPLSRVEYLLKNLDTGGGGGGGPVSDETYNDIMDKMEARNELTSPELAEMWEDD